jgi:deazaflavin-dependent oxidoreductase (nitroreductase family)
MAGGSHALARMAARLLRTRWLVRAPIRLYRWRLGGMFGRRLLMLEHTGRASGKTRYVVLEVVDRPSSGEWVVASGFGTAAQWFRNIVADGHVRVFIGSRHPVAAVARVLSPDETAAALGAYAKRQPRTWAVLRPVFEEALGAEISDEGSSLPLVLLTQTSGTVEGR